ncbi:hypothetical protein ABZ318_01530 [Streptomyces sp. NPDC006197]|uniref:hypothetical protein n=1 Tax=Streptomyces sp. NPDC006197 TaxID=3156685 RepID=UPI0033B9BBF3
MAAEAAQEPEYVRGTVAIPSLGYLTKALTIAEADLALEIVMMAGCGLRNGEARAVNVHNVVAQDVYRVRGQIHSNTLRPAKLKHRKVGEFHEVPQPLRRVGHDPPRGTCLLQRRGTRLTDAQSAAGHQPHQQLARPGQVPLDRLDLAPE